MRKSPVTLRIPEPCTQPWAAMTPQGAGRHCAACQKVVIDFTQKTDAEILAVLAAAPGQACGRFGASQLGRALQLPLAPRPAWWQTAVAATVAATVALLGFRTLLPPGAQAQASVSQAPANGGQVAATGTAPPFQAKPAEVERTIGEVSSDIVITGRVVDKETGEGLPGVSVLIQTTAHGVSTDSEGRFSLPVMDAERQLPLLIICIGYVGVELPQPTGPAAQNISVKMEVSVQGGIGYHPIYTPQGMWSRLRSIPWRVKNAFDRN